MTGAVAMRRASLYLLAGTGAGAVLGYAFWFLLARTAASDVVGTSGAAVSLLAVVSLLSTAGLAPTVLAAIGENRERGGAITGRAAMVVAAAAMAAAGVLTTVAGALGSDRTGAIGAVAFVAAAGAGASSAVFDAAAIGAGRSGVVLARTVTLGVTRLVLAGVIAADGAIGAESVLVVWAVSAVAAATMGYTGLRRAGVPIGLGRLRGSGLLRRAGWNQVVTAAAQTPGYLLPVIVTVVVSSSANAGYYLAWQIAGGCFMIAAATTPALIAQAAGRDEATIEARVTANRRLTAILLVPAAVAVAAVGPYVLTLLGEDYSDAHWVLWVFALAAFPDAYTSISVARLRARREERRAAVLNLAMGSATVGGALVLVPLLGAVGAAVAFGVSQGAGTVYCSVERRRRQGRGGSADSPTIAARLAR